MATRLRPLGAAGIPTRKVMMLVAAAAACFSLLVFVAEQSGELPLPPAWAVTYTNGGGGVGMPHAHGLSRHGRGIFAGGAAAWRVGSRRQQQQHDPWPDSFPGADLRFVAAMGTDLRHVGIVHASRGGWRRVRLQPGCRTYDLIQFGVTYVRWSRTTPAPCAPPSRPGWRTRC